MIRIGIDLGGTKIEAIALDQDGMELARQRVPTPRDSYQNVVEAITGIVLALESELNERALVGVGMPGSISPRTGLIRNSNLQIMNGKPFDRDLLKALNREVRVENDANCFAVSEASDGAGADSRVVFGAILGTGCGGGIAVDGRIIGGFNGIGGEWGHSPLPWLQEGEWPAPECYCGKRGCQELYISGTGFRRDYMLQATQELSGGEIARQALAGEPVAKAAFERYVDRLARSLAVVINMLDPDVIIFGGGMSNVTALYDLVPPLLSKYAFSDGVSTPVRRAKHGDSSGVRGAAWLWSLEDLRQAA
ncbi:MAG: ROK family protein [Alphaproteobacteria bacterium]